MANRYANLEGSKKISEDFNNINIGFDRVQAEMDTKGTPADAQAKADAAEQAAIDTAAAALTAHKQRGADEHPTAKGNSAGFMSAADKLKSDASTSAATSDTLMQRDTAGRAKVTAPVAADDIARKAETDAVQSNLDSHAADTDIHVTADDHAKLDSIAEGAEVNQNAFAVINDVEASSKSDTVTLVGGTGIAVSTNPVTKEIMLTATSEATPGAHASSHVTGGSDVIPDAVIGGASGLMSGADAKFVRQDGESKTGAQAKADAAESAAKEYTDNQVEAITDRLDSPERAAITLQTGIHVVQADQDAAFKLAGLQGRTVLNYQSQVGIYGVLNPYVIRYGANLLPPFYEYESSAGITVSPWNFEKPYIAIQKANSTDGHYIRFQISVVPNSEYTFVCDHNGYVAVTAGDGTTRLVSWTNAKEVTFNAGENTFVYVFFGNFNGTSGVVGTFTFANPMLNIGNSALPFVLRQDAMLALQTEIHANPDTGANPDMVFDRDGQYFKLAKWKRVILDGSLGWVYSATWTGYKRVGISSPFGSDGVTGTQIVTKFDGKSLTNITNNNMTAIDQVVFDTSYSSAKLQLSISNTDSGWGDSYTPTSDEIKAYFMGWKMYQEGNRATPYTSGTKQWFKIQRPADSSVASIPTDTYSEWTPYQLLYQLATPVVEPITSEGQLTLIEGDNQLEVGTGIVLREKAPINNNLPVAVAIGDIGNPNKYKIKKVLAVYKDSIRDPRWYTNTVNANGNEKARIDGVNYDPSSAYSVTYLMLDKYPAVDVTGTYAENEKALLLDTVRTLQENTTRISVLESKKAEKDAPAWITPTLLNGWVNFTGGLSLVGYYKDSMGYVHLRGVIKPGAMGSTAFILPTGYRPTATQVYIVAANTDNANDVLGRLNITSAGAVIPLNATGTNITTSGWASLENIPPFLGV
ncbi:MULTISPECIES: hypothetical protein [unclassified Paenibacillus]|uniref:hypothetical protein n=1 Tax=unclassified Paenibacillus TaxID=185978 RepID=UPI00040DF033|nr:MULTISPECIES: hypothetical protein [unclassified Paenibacillus]